MPPISARARALDLLIAIETRGVYANLALSDLPELDPRDRALITELVNGTTRRRRALDYQLSRCLTQPLERLTPAIRNNLRMGAYQLLFSAIAPHAALDEAVKLARRYGHEGVSKLTNAVLRRLQREAAELPWPDPAADPVRALAVRESLPDWIVSEWVEAYGSQTACAMAEASNRTLPLTLRVNTLKTTPQDFLLALREGGLPAAPSPLVPEGIRFGRSVPISALAPFSEDAWYVQGEAAMLVSHLLGPHPGETVLDVGAAPGGKSTHLAALMQNRGRVIALDRHAGRLGLVAANARRLGATIVEPREGDATQPWLEPIDRVLVDAPCSGLGVLDRKADLRWRLSREEADGLPALQRAMLEAVAPALKPGGVLVYATCTVRRAENQGVVEAFLGAHPEFFAGDLASHLPPAWRTDATSGMIQLMPHRHGVEGFFIARLERRG